MLGCYLQNQLNLYFICRFDKELNKEVAIKVIDLDEA